LAAAGSSVIKAGKGFAYLAALDESMARRARTASQ
jgi:hypothetical protein